MSPRVDRTPSTWLPRLALPLTAVLLATGCVTTAPAQTTGPVYVESSQPGNERVIDPPGRVGKIGLLAGAVTLTDTRTGDTESATLNWPVTSGQRLATARGGRAEVRIGSLAVRLDGDSMVDFNRIDDQLVQIVVQSGSVALRVRNRDLLREIDVLTPRERITLDDVGRYRIDVDRVPGVTGLTANVGQARITSNGGRMIFTVQSGQRGEARALPSPGFQLVSPAPDVFDDWVAARDRRDDVVASSRYVSPETTGIEVLDDHGSWRSVPDVGTVWFPAAVPVGWAPYRTGRWTYVAPWGWTWIDDAPWGFAPFHYGRWVYVGGVWGWYPGVYVARPVYAPALVGWYGAPGVSVSVSVGYPVVGWFPLGWREPYIPPWRYTPRYITAVNVPYVPNPHNIAPPPRYVYQAPGTATWAPNDAIVRAQPIQRVVRDAPAEFVRAPAAVAPPLPVPQGFTKRIVPVGSDVDLGRGVAGAPDRVGAPRVVAPQTPPTVVAPGMAPPPANVDPGVVRPQPRVIGAERGAERGPERGFDRVPERAPVAPAPQAGPVMPPPVVPAPHTPAQRDPEFVGRPRPVQVPDAPRGVVPPPAVAPAAPAAPAAPPVHTAPAPRMPVQIAPPHAAPPVAREGGGPKMGSPREDGPARGGGGGGKVMRE